MINAYGMQLTREELLERVSSMSQIAGARVFQYTEGKACGVKAVEVNTGDGLVFTVLPDRGMDIGAARFRNIPVSWQSKVGVVSPKFFENQGHEWLRSFYGGLLATCGLKHVGEPVQDGNVFHGLHGRVSNTPAERFWIDEYWDGDDYVIKVTGKVRETVIYGENLVLTREIKCIYGQNRIFVKDSVQNEGYTDSPFMIMYHINQTFPIVSEYSRFYTSADNVEAANDAAKETGDDFSKIDAPIKDYQFKTFIHNMPMDRDKVYQAIINENLELGVYIAYNPKTLPVGNQWKQLGQQDYAVAMEPANTYNVGIVEARKNGWLPVLKPGETAEINLEVGVLSGAQEIESFKAKL